MDEKVIDDHMVEVGLLYDVEMIFFCILRVWFQAKHVEVDSHSSYTHCKNIIGVRNTIVRLLRNSETCG